MSVEFMDMSTVTFVLVAIVVLWNIITFLLYWIDKAKARKNKWRISEGTLLTCAFLMGGVGALLGMSLFRHKTKHLKFRLLVPLSVVVNICIVVVAICLTKTIL